MYRDVFKCGEILDIEIKVIYFIVSSVLDLYLFFYGR